MWAFFDWLEMDTWCAHEYTRISSYLYQSFSFCNRSNYNSITCPRLHAWRRRFNDLISLIIYASWLKRAVFNNTLIKSYYRKHMLVLYANERFAKPEIFIFYTWRKFCSIYGHSFISKRCIYSEWVAISYYKLLSIYIR